ncbi:hypothetical protein, partial [Zunongwangia profunda]|uniref:hypothetical protein n=1 Tax=Zunongwangia profunda TaxID=398743 RepID=UPI0030DBA33D
SPLKRLQIYNSFSLTTKTFFKFFFSLKYHAIPMNIRHNTLSTPALSGCKYTAFYFFPAKLF